MPQTFFFMKILKRCCWLSYHQFPWYWISFFIYLIISAISNKIKRHSITKKGLEIIEYFNSMRMLNGVLFLHNRYIRSIFETHSIFRDEKHDGEIFWRNYLWWEIRAFWSHGTSYSCEVLIPFLGGNKVKV